MLRPMQPRTTPSDIRPAAWTPFALGFRPLFLLAGVAAVVLMAPWPWLWRGAIAVPASVSAVDWHAHEMLFGYTAAVVAGFLLTAVRNWTGIPTCSGGRLAALTVVWLAARVLPWIGAVPPLLIVAVDVAFLPLVAFALLRPLWAGQSKANRVFFFLLLAMAAANLLSHLRLLGVELPVGDARRVMVDLILLLIVLMAGRVLPFFARTALPGFVPVQRAWVEKATFLTLGVLILGDLLPVLPASGFALLWLAFAVLQAFRFGAWFDRRVFAAPVLWVLYSAYAWLVVGAMLNGLAMLRLFAPTLALHALTVGAIGVFTLGMMARVALGHTGRPIAVARSIALAFVLGNLAAALRVFGPVLLPDAYASWVESSAALWVAAFVLFAWRYAPILLRARIDGQPG